MENLITIFFYRAFMKKVPCHKVTTKEIKNNGQAQGAGTLNAQNSSKWLVFHKLFAVIVLTFLLIVHFISFKTTFIVMQKI